MCVSVCVRERERVKVTSKIEFKIRAYYLSSAPSFHKFLLKQDVTVRFEFLIDIHGVGKTTKVLEF